MTYGIIGAMDSEIALLTKEMNNSETISVANLTFYKGELCSKPVVVVKCGVGKVNAAACAQLLIERFRIDALINIGVAGGVSPVLCVQDVVVSTALVQHDFDLRPFGYTKGFLGREYGDVVNQPTMFYADETLRACCVRAAKNYLSSDHACYEGIIASGDEFVAASNRRQVIYSEFRAMASEMEGAAIAQVATQNGVPFLVLRTISDLADGSAPVSFETVVTFAADLAANIIMQMLSEG